MSEHSSSFAAMTEFSGRPEKRFLLVRHAAHDSIERTLVGRTLGVRLDGHGRRQAEALARRLAKERVSAVQSSPQERARETAAIIAAAHGVKVSVAGELDEADFGSWAGLSFEVLNGDSGWQAWNRSRGSTRPPGGESMAELRARIVSHLERLGREGPDGLTVMITHAEVIRAALLHWLGRSLDDYSSIEVAPASVSILAAGRTGIRIVAASQNWADESHEQFIS
jgi:probable phosphoglycerate mutase